MHPHLAMLPAILLATLLNVNAPYWNKSICMLNVHNIVMTLMI